MTRYLLSVLSIIVALSASAFSQTTTSASPEPTPTTKPPVKRRTFDQFDLSNGIRVPSSSSTASAYGTPAQVGAVDQVLFDTINQISESASFVESELARAVAQNAEITAGSQFGKFFMHRLEGVMMLAESSRLDPLGLGAVKTASNKKLLFQVQDSANDAIQIAAVEAGIYNLSPKEWDGVSQKYNVALLDTRATFLRLDKPALLKAMMRRMTSDLAQLERQLVVKK